MDIQVLPLAPNAVLPVAASTSTRDHIPAGHGVQEQCLPFTAAAALGLLVRSPIDFGLCAPENVPTGAHPFRCPLDIDGANDARVFYVRDDYDCGFENNTFTLDSLPLLDPSGGQTAVLCEQPGISFFDRMEQQDLFKIHLPYVLRTPETIDSLFTGPINRDGQLTVLAGLVETSWYAHPVSLVARKPELGSVHVAAGDVIGQVIFLPRTARRASVRLVQSDSDDMQLIRGSLLTSHLSRLHDRAAYRTLARGQHGRIESCADTGGEGAGQSLPTSQRK
jgi:hypothetical protein